MQYLKTITLLTLCILQSLISANLVHAESSGFSLTPPTVELLLAPNKKFIQAFTLTNQGQSSNFVVNLHLATPSDEQGHMTVSPTPLDPSKIPLVIRLESSDLALGVPFSLAEGASRQLVFSVEGASSDVSVDTYLALVVSSSPSTPLVASYAATTPGISSLILTTLTPDGTLPVNLEITDFAPPSLHDSALPLRFSPAVHNHGTIMLRTGGELVIKSAKGEEVYHQTLYNNLVLKDSKRLILGIGQGDVPAELLWQPHWYDLGLYNIRLTVQTAGGRTIQEVERSVWVAPLRLITILLIALILISLLIILKWRQSKKSSSQH